MQIIVLANDQQKEELLNNATDDEVRVTATNTVESLTQYQNCDAIIDLLFDRSSERIKLLKTFSEKPVIINSVILTLQRIDVSFVRMNAWPGFMKRSIVEASTSNKNIVEQVEEVFSKVGKKVQWVPDKPGFITARVIAMIINEAWFALGEGISTPKEIDAAMKLGTNYPYGPFEWCDKIGAKNVYDLLAELAKSDQRYKPAPLLEKQITR